MATTLVNRVGQKISLTIGSSSTPSQSQIVDWLNEGLDTLLRLLPYDYFPLRQTTKEYTAASGNPEVSGDIPDNNVKLVNVSIRNTLSEKYRPCKVIPIEAYDAIKSGIDVFRSVSNDYPVATIRKGKIYAITTASTASKQLRIEFASNGTALSTTSTTASENPVVDRLIVEYAAMQAKYSNDETQDWASKLQEWYKSAATFSTLGFSQSGGKK